RAPDSDSELIANNIGTLLQRVAGSSVHEIDRLISELHTLRELLQSESARVQREITEYAHVSQSAMQSTKVIAESLAQWKITSAPQSARGRTLLLPHQPITRDLPSPRAALRTDHQDSII